MIAEQSIAQRTALCSAMSARLFDVRRIMGLSQANLGELCGITRTRVIQIEHGGVRLSPCQMGAVLLLCLANRPAFDYLIRAKVPSADYFRYLQNREAGLLPDLSFSLPRGLREGFLSTLKPAGSGKLVPPPKAEKQRLCEALLPHLGALRGTLRISQDRFSAQCGFSRVRLIRMEKGELPLTYTQACAVLFVALINERGREYLFTRRVLDARFLCALEQCPHPDGLPLLDWAAHPSLFPDYAPYFLPAGGTDETKTLQ